MGLILFSSPLLLASCVASTSFEQAKSTAEVQLEAHRRTAQKLEGTEARLAELMTEREGLLALKGELEGDLERTEGEMSQVEMGQLTASKERDEQTQLVTQLRGELARAGAHIKDYEAEAAEFEAKTAELSRENGKLKAQVAGLEGEKARLEERLSLCSDATEDESLFEPAEPAESEGSAEAEAPGGSPDEGDGASN